MVLNRVTEQALPEMEKDSWGVSELLGYRERQQAERAHWFVYRREVVESSGQTHSRDRSSMLGGGLSLRVSGGKGSRRPPVFLPGRKWGWGRGI